MSATQRLVIPVTVREQQSDEMGTVTLALVSGLTHELALQGLVQLDRVRKLC